MVDDPTKSGPADRSRINIHQAHEVAYWTKALGVSEQRLREAVAAVGVMAADVRAHLGVSKYRTAARTRTGVSPQRADPGRGVEWAL